MAERELKIVVKGEDRASSVFEKVGRSLGGLGKLAAGLATAGLAAGVGALGAGLLGAVGEAREAQAGLAQLGAVLESTAGKAGVTKDVVLGLADSLSQASGGSRFADDAILAGQNMLLTFTKVGQDVFPRATQAMVDMAQAMGTDVKGQSIALGKALNDPIAGLAALGRVGVQFSAEQEATIRSMMALGDVAGAQGVILGELETQFGGSAAAAAKAAGPFARVRAQFGEIAEGIGTKLLPLIDRFGNALSDPAVMGAIQSLADGLVSGIERAVDWFTGTALPLLQGAWQTIQDGLTTLRASLAGEWINDDSIRPIHQIIGVFGQLVAAFQEGGLQAALDVLQPYIESIFTNIVTYIQGQLPVWMETLAQWGQAAWQWLVDAMPTILSTLFSLMTMYPRVIWEHREAIVGAFSSLATAAWQWIQEAIPPLVEKLGEWWTALVGWVQAQLPGWNTQLAAWMNALWQWIVDAIPPLTEKLGEWWTALVGWVQGQLPGWNTQLAAWMDALWKWIVDAIPPLTEKLGEWWSALVGWVEGQLPTWNAQLAGWMDALWQWIVDAVPPMLEQLGAFLLAMTNWIVNTGLPALVTEAAKLGDALVGWVEDEVLPKLGTELGKILTAIRNWITNTAVPGMLSAAVAIGEAIGDGIAQGIQNAIDWVLQQLRELVDMLPGWLKTRLGIGSPSKVFMELGEAIGQGLAAGISNSSRDVMRAMSGLAALPGTGLTLPAVGAIGGGGLMPAMATAGAGTAGSSGTTTNETHVHNVFNIYTPMDWEVAAYEIEDVLRRRSR